MAETHDGTHGGPKQVRFKTNCSWAGERFSYVPGQEIAIDEDIARARQDAGLGEITGDMDESQTDETADTDAATETDETAEGESGEAKADGKKSKGKK